MGVRGEDWSVRGLFYLHVSVWKLYQTLSEKYYADALRLLHLPRIEFCMYCFLLASFFEQSFEDCIGNTEHSNVMWTLSAIVIFALLPTHTECSGMFCHLML